MPYRQEQFLRDEIYHIIIRGIDDNIIFKNIDDYYRGIFSVYEFNTVSPVVIRERRKIRARLKQALKKENRDPISVDLRDKLVEVLTFCFMPNHLHLLLKQLKNDGISRFMKKIGVGYGGFFNRKYSRKGYVFQNRFKAVPIKTDAQLKTVFVYIHTNPISLIEPKWKEKGIRKTNEVIEFLENYKWSSYRDYIGENNFPSVTDREFVLWAINGEQKCREFVNNWITYKGEIKNFSEINLE